MVVNETVVFSMPRRGPGSQLQWSTQHLDASSDGSREEIDEIREIYCITGSGHPRQGGGIGSEKRLQMDYR